MIEYRNENTESWTFNDQREAYTGFYNAAKIELDHDKYLWADEVRVC